MGGERSHGVPSDRLGKPQRKGDTMAEEKLTRAGVSGKEDAAGDLLREVGCCLVHQLIGSLAARFQGGCPEYRRCDPPCSACSSCTPQHRRPLGAVKRARRAVGGQGQILEDCFDEVTIAQVLQIADRWPARPLLLVVAVPQTDDALADQGGQEHGKHDDGEGCAPRLILS